MKKFFKEFEEFLLHSDAGKLAVGVVIGAGFNQLTTSFANNILTPPLGLLIGDFDFSKLAIPIGNNTSIMYGAFLQALLNFMVIAFSLFVLVKAYNRIAARRASGEQKEKNKEIEILREIRDELRAERGAKPEAL